MAATLPTELLLEIFSRYNEPFVVCRVCSHWRQIALAHGALWTSIELFDSTSTRTQIVHAQKRASRAGASPLNIVRVGGSQDVGDEEEEEREEMDRFVLDLFPRCRSFTYESILDIVCGGHRASFLSELIQVPAPFMEELRLLSSDDWGSKTIAVCPQVKSLISASTRYPALRNLILDGVCLPLHRMDISGLVQLDLYPGEPCKDDTCAAKNNWCSLIRKIAHASPGLKEVNLYSNLAASDWILPDDNAVVARSAWPCPEKVTLGYTLRGFLDIINLSQLTELSMGVGDNASATGPILTMLDASPLLRSLDLHQWLTPPTDTLPMGRRVLLAHLTHIGFDGLHIERTRQLFAALSLPALEILKLVQEDGPLPDLPPLPARSATLTISGRFSASVPQCVAALTCLEHLFVKPLDHYRGPNQKLTRPNHPIVPRDILTQDLRVPNVFLNVCVRAREHLEAAEKAAQSAARPGVNVKLTPCYTCKKFY